jgi:hypothetical protein
MLVDQVRRWVTFVYVNIAGDRQRELLEVSCVSQALRSDANALDGHDKPPTQRSDDADHYDR